MEINPEISKYMGSLAKKSWEKTRKKSQNMSELGKLGAQKRWKNHKKAKNSSD